MQRSQEQVRIPSNKQTDLAKRSCAMEKTKTTKTCPACNSQFECNQNDISNCFCNSVVIHPEDLQKLKTKYTNCLCANCLNLSRTNKSKAFSSILSFILYFIFSTGYAQFAGPVGSINTTAMHKDSSAFIAWASNCVVNRGLQDVSTPSLGTANGGEDVNGTLKAGDNPVVSLGDGGYAILTFPSPIKNGPGYDFAVFENSFSDSFLELAFVEVSSDGLNFFRFSPNSNMQFTTQIGAFDELGNATKLNNLAGKYRVNYGTPFDLEELNMITGLDINSITHVKIIDVVGSINAPYATYDKNNNPINDPFPTGFGNGGFDLDAVGVIHQNPSGINQNESNPSIHIYPNPCNNYLIVSTENNIETTSYELNDLKGNTVLSKTNNKGKAIFDLQNINNGVYILIIKSNNNFNIAKKIIIQHL